MYALGVDLGTTFTAAAVWRDGRAEISPLGMRTAAIPSVVLARPDGSFLTGEAAARRAALEPSRVAREFKRRLGDSTPLLLGGSPYSAEALTARLLSSVIASVADREGGLPGSVCICHPANWGPFKTDLLRQAVRLADLAMPVLLTTEPEAAAVSYARQERLAPGDTVAVYDLGGGTFDAAVLRRTAAGFEIRGQPEGIERLGGIDIDAAVFSHVARAVGEALTDLDEDDPAAVSAVARLREECTSAKEALSSDTDVTIPVLLPALTTEVRLTRAELESMVRPSLYDSIESLKRAVRSAGVEPVELSAVLLVGGSSRMPLVAQMVGSELGLPVAVDAHPKHSIALGAAWRASGAELPAEPEPAPATVVVATSPRPEPEPAPPVVPPRRPAESRRVEQRVQQPPAPQPPPVQPVQRAQPVQPVQRQQAPPTDPGRTPPAYGGPDHQGQQFQGQPYQGQPNQGQPYQGQPYQGQPFRGQQQFADLGQEAPLAYHPTPKTPVTRRPVVIGGLAAVAGLLVVLSVWTAFNARDHFGMTGGADPTAAGGPTAGAPSAPSGSGQADVPPTTAPGTTAQDGGGAAAPTQAGMLVVSVQVSGRGSVTSSDGRISCPGTCRETIPADSTVTLRARGAGFIGWSQCPQRDGASCTVGGRSGQAFPLAQFSAGTTAPPPPPTSAPPTTLTPPPTTRTTPPPTTTTAPPSTTATPTATEPKTTATAPKSSAPPSSVVPKSSAPTVP